MRISSYRRPSRYAALAVAIVINLLALVALRVELSVPERTDSRLAADVPPLIVSFLDLVEPSAEEPAPAAPLQTRPKPVPRASESIGSAIQLPPPGETAPQAPAHINFDMELKRAAQAAIDEAEEKARQGAALNRPGVPESLRPTPPANSKFAWSYRVQPRSPFEVPLNEHCMLVMGVVACRLGKIAPRGDLFADMRKLKTPEELGLQPSRSLEPVGHETRRRLAEVSRLLGEWRAEHGSYPEDLSDLVANLPAVERKDGPRPQIVDTWDHKLVYNRPPHAPPCDYDLYSMGPNGVDDHGQRDDIVTCGSTADVRF